MIDAEWYDTHQVKACPSFFSLFSPTLAGLRRPAEALEMDPTADILSAAHEKAKARAGKLIVQHFDILSALRQVGFENWRYTLTCNNSYEHLGRFNH
jgi:hypothetical protein